MKQLESGLVSKKLSKNESTLLTQIQSRQTETNRISQYTVSDVEKNLKKKANYDFDSVKSIDSEMVLKEQFKNNDLPVIGGINIPEVKIELVLG